MAAAGEGRFGATIPGGRISASWDLMLFFEIGFASGEARRWPDWQRRQPYFVIETVDGHGGTAG